MNGTRTSTFPGIYRGEPFRYEGSIWAGAPESTWFDVVSIDTPVADITISLGHILKQNLTTGKFEVATASDLVTDVSGLPGLPLAISTDKDTKIEASNADGTVGVGTSGRVDQNRLKLDTINWKDMTVAQKTMLSAQLRAWGFSLVNVEQV